MKLWFLFFVVSVWTLAPTEGRAVSRALLNHVKRSAGLLAERSPSYDDVKRSANLFSKHMRRQEEEEVEEVEAPRKLKPIEFTNAEDLMEEVNNILKYYGKTMDDVEDFIKEEGDFPEKNRELGKALLVLSAGGYDANSYLEELFPDPKHTRRQEEEEEEEDDGAPKKPINFASVDDLINSVEVKNILKSYGKTMEDVDDIIGDDANIPAEYRELAKALTVLSVGGYDIDSYLKELVPHSSSEEVENSSSEEVERWIKEYLEEE